MFGMKETVTEFGRNIGTKIRVVKRSKPEDKSLAGQVILITGANRGMGKVVAEDCAARGARVVMGCRSLEAAQKAMDDIRSRVPAADLVAYQLDLSSFASVHTFVGSVMQKEPKIDVLVNNAAIITNERTMTGDGHETMIQVNYYSPVMLTLMLAPYMEKTSRQNARIVTVGAVGHAYVADIQYDDMDSANLPKFSPFMVYLHSKLALMMFVRELAVRRGANRGARVYCVDPGISPTDLATGSQPKTGITAKIVTGVFGTIARTVQEAADSIVKVILMEKEGYDPRVYYFMDGTQKALSKTAADDSKAGKLWDLTAQVVPIMHSIGPDEAAK